MEVVGHGGAGAFYHGNSRQAIEKAIAIGVDRIEIDVQQAGDGTIVLVHDEHAYIAGRKVAVRALDVPTLRECFDGLLTLSEAVELIDSTMPLVIDLKFAGYEYALARDIIDLGIAARTIVASTYAWSLHLVHNHVPETRIGFSIGHIAHQKHLAKAEHLVLPVSSIAFPLPIIFAARAIHASHIMLSYRICTPFLAAAIKRAGFGIFVWTVDNPADIRRIARMQPEGIISNRPDLVREVLS